jgi:tripeptidyl-peptidase-1
VTALSSREDPIWPGFLRSIYHTATYEPLSAKENRLAVVGFNRQFPSQEDLTAFVNHYATHTQTATFTVVQVNGDGGDPDFPTILATSEIEYTAAMAFPTQLIFYSIGGESEWAPDGMPVAEDAYLQWFNHILGDEPNMPQTISIASGNNEWDFPKEYARALCGRFLELGARGVSVLIASGDDGVGDDEDGEGCRDRQGNFRFIPQFPASCTCSLLSSLPDTRQAQAQVAHQTAMALQVPVLLASAALKATPRKRRASPEAASQTYFHAQCTSSV